MPYFIKKSPEKPARFYEATSTRLSLPGQEETKSEDWPGWRRLTGAAPLRELKPGIFEKMSRIAKWLYDSNPLAKRIIEYIKNFVVGEGIYFDAEDARVKEILDAFWYDDVNNWPLRQHDRILELCLYGESIWPVTVNPSNGHVRLGFIDPLDVKEVVPNEDNCLILEKIVLARPIHGKTELSIIRRDENPNSDTFGYLSGECFFFAINKVSNATRGASDLLPLIDWIDAYDQFLFTRLERQMNINNFCWDVTLEGADKYEIEQFLKNLPPPTPGTVRVHNEKVTWNVVAPKLEARDANQESRLIRNHILSGAGFPPYYFADTEGVRAVAYEQAFPTEKMLITRQKYFKAMIEYVFNFVIDQAIIHKRLPANVNRKFEIVFPEISLRDVERLSRALKNVTLSLEHLQQNGLVTNREAKKIIRNLLSQMGLELEELNGKRG